MRGSDNLIVIVVMMMMMMMMMTLLEKKLKTTLIRILDVFLGASISRWKRIPVLELFP